MKLSVSSKALQIKGSLNKPTGASSNTGISASSTVSFLAFASSISLAMALASSSMESFLLNWSGVKNLYKSQLLFLPRASSSRTSDPISLKLESRNLN